MHHKGTAYVYSQPWAVGWAAGSQPAGAATAGGTAPSTGAGAPAASEPSPVGTGAVKKKKQRDYENTLCNHKLVDEQLPAEKIVWTKTFI